MKCDPNSSVDGIRRHYRVDLRCHPRSHWSLVVRNVAACWPLTAARVHRADAASRAARLLSLSPGPTFPLLPPSPLLTLSFLVPQPVLFLTVWSRRTVLDLLIILDLRLFSALRSERFNLRFFFSFPFSFCFRSPDIRSLIPSPD
ncbi:hypothetical protein VTN49DRAFT_779 [Thermomyces lanuginosus]|uniref:uncharacterized protein n=1 Tax=Thermomyces lanuginosus TaxID=5541 RepID=UPI00374479F0